MTVLRMGHDPFKVWNGEIIVDGFKPLGVERSLPGRLSGSVYAKHLDKTGTSPSGHDVHAYPPWQYSLILPFAYLPKKHACAVFTVFTLALFCLCVNFMPKMISTDNKYKYVAAMISVLTVLPVLLMSVSFYGQWSIFTLAAIFGMIFHLEREHDFFAGFCWAMAMVKPHFAVLFFIPLAMSCKWKTIATAVFICVLLSIPPAIMCKTSPVDMVFQIFSAGSLIIRGNGFVPWPLFTVLRENIPGNFLTKTVAYFGLLAGLILCAWISLRLKNKTWMLRISAVTVISLAWTHIHISDLILYALPVLVILVHAFASNSAGGGVRTLPRIVVVATVVVFLNCLTFETPREVFENFFKLPDGILYLPLNLARCVLIPASWISVIWVLLHYCETAKKKPPIVE
ncbi:MAG: DUF2029 domain-containing protein [Kiritimatiellaeota bacterium]|nr:DUF2029 domain-containing protein [Kiritimatiellota bacterium]